MKVRVQEFMKVNIILILTIILLICNRCKETTTHAESLSVSQRVTEGADQVNVKLDSIYDQVRLLKIRTEDKTNLYAIQKNNKWGVTNIRNEKLTEVIYDEVVSLKIAFALKLENEWSIHNAKCEELKSFSCDELEGHRDTHFIASKGNLKALIGLTSMTDFLFDEITGPRESEGYFYGSVGNRWSAYDLQGMEINDLTQVQIAALKALNDYSVSLYGFGPIRLGMRVGEVEDVVGIKFVENGSTSDCIQMEFETGFPLLRFLFEKKEGIRLLERIYFGETVIKTKSGVGINSTEEDLLSAYGDKMLKKPHKYNENCVYYYFVPVDEKDQLYRLNFDYDFVDDRVRHFSVGRIPAISYVEGCF